MKYESPTESHLEIMAKIKVFWKVGQMWRLRSLGQKCWYPVKVLVTRNDVWNMKVLVSSESSCHEEWRMKYESPISSYMEIMYNIQIF